MEEATDRKEKTGMRTGGWGNFFFLENEDGSVSVGNVSRVERAWHKHVNPLGDDDRWGTAYRLLVRNLDTSKLGL
jgi:hypothetical protein